MTVSIGVSDVERFRGAIARRLGLQYDESKLNYLADVLQRRTDSVGSSASQYLEWFDAAEVPNGELRALARELTVPETYFFRHLDQFRAFAEVALPDRLSRRGGTQGLSLLSAGCASGEEPYTLALIVREGMDRVAGLSPSAAASVSIRAVDVNPAPLEKARLGRYTAWALRETPAAIQQRWFRAEGRDFVLDASIRRAVQFDERNLTLEDPELWQAGVYDVVFCRNVLMYFTPEHARAVVARIAHALAPGGYLFLGHAETLRGLSHDYHLRHTHGTFYYQRKDVLEDAPDDPLPPRSRPRPNGAPPADSDWAATWLETVQRASDRIQALAETPRRSTESREVSRSGTRARSELTVALELLKKERFIEALELLARLPDEAARDPDAVLLRAALLTHSGKLERAEQVCKELLAIDDLNAGAHYLLALCREGAGDKQGALDHDQVATYLDPTFAMPRLHLGLLARRNGERETARRELEQALALLRREEGSRLLLFGGGFGRDALVALCRAELIAAGGKL
ncbi:MAG: methyltransferase domain-containing protein [Polyangiaceae bacterium]|nr:methyltransferase domain-containing protein [Polyangiaceae bacterium]